MFQLILTIMSIVLIGATVMATITYTNPGLVIEKESQIRVESGFNALHQGWSRYSEANQVIEWNCETHTTGLGVYEDCNRQITNPGFLPALDWQDALVPDYTFLPRPLRDMAWSYGENTSGWFFCMSGPIAEPLFKGVLRAQRNMPIDSVIISDVCGSTDNIEPPLLNLDAPIAITYWVQRDGAYTQWQMGGQ